MPPPPRSSLCWRAPSASPHLGDQRLHLQSLEHLLPTTRSEPVEPQPRCQPQPRPTPPSPARGCPRTATPQSDALPSSPSTLHLPPAPCDTTKQYNKLYLNIGIFAGGRVLAGQHLARLAGCKAISFLFFVFLGTISHKLLALYYPSHVCHAFVPMLIGS